MKPTFARSVFIVLFSVSCVLGISHAADPAKPAQDEGIAVSMTSDIVVAKVLWVKGNFSATSPDGKARKLDRESAIYLHDTLSTDNTAQSQIVFTDDSLMTFRPATKFYIEYYEYKPQADKKSAGKYFMNLIEGGFRTVTGLIAKGDPESYQVQTPVATIGVRGTDYTVALSGGQLFIGYNHGRPCVSNKEGSLCLDDKTKYAQVSANTAPVPLSQQPGALSNNLSVVPANFTSGGSVGGDPGMTTLPGDQSISSFCIN